MAAQRGAETRAALLREGGQEHQGRQGRRSDGEPLSRGCRGVAQRVQSVGPLAYLLRLLRHLGVAAGIVGDRAEGVRGQRDAEGAEHADGREPNSVQPHFRSLKHHGRDLVQRHRPSVAHSRQQPPQHPEPQGNVRKAQADDRQPQHGPGPEGHLQTPVERFLGGLRRTAGCLRSRVHPDQTGESAQNSARQEGEGHQGMDTFFTQLRAASSSTDGNAVTQRVERLGAEVLDENVLPRTRQYLELNEQQLQNSNEQNKAIAERLALALLLVGTCGAVAGLVAGYGVARNVSRAVYQLSVPIRNVAGKLAEVVGPVVVSGDPSVKDLETALKRLAVQVGSVVEELHARHREAMRADQLAAVGQLAAGLAHELRNPLMSMKILVQSARRDGDAGTLTARDLVVLDEEITRLENLLQAFLDFARPAKLEKKEIDAGSVIRRTVDFLSGRAEQRNVEIACRLPAEPLIVQADEAQFRQVLLNLLLNALDAVRNGGRVWVEAEADEAGPDDGRSMGAAKRVLRVRIADNGRGLPAKDRNRIYEPFFSTKDTGLGLGLAVCQHFVRAHGGELRESDRPGGGAVFELLLSATQESASGATA